MAAAQGTNHEVTVGPDLTFSPDSILAAVGDTVQFVFVGKNHSVVQSAFEAPCVRGSLGFDSGFQPVATNTAAVDFSIKISTNDPIWFFCAQTAHCEQGMVGAINAPTTGDTFASFRAAALAIGTAAANGPTSPATSATGPASSASGGTQSAPSTSAPAPSTSAPTPSTTGTVALRNALSEGTIAAIALSVVLLIVGVLLCAVLRVYCRRRRRGDAERAAFVRTGVLSPALGRPSSPLQGVLPRTQAVGELSNIEERASSVATTRDTVADARVVGVSRMPSIARTEYSEGPPPSYHSECPAFEPPPHEVKTVTVLRAVSE